MQPDDPERAKRVERYKRKMGPDQAAALWKSRAKLIAIYLKTPAIFSNGPDGRAWGCDAWYNPEEWKLNEKGEAVRTVTTVTEKGK